MIILWKRKVGIYLRQDSFDTIYNEQNQEGAALHKALSLSFSLFYPLIFGEDFPKGPPFSDITELWELVENPILIFLKARLCKSSVLC